MKVLRKLLIALVALFVVALIALAVVPFLLKDRVAARAHAAVDGAVDARVDWGGVGLTFFRDFPNLTVRLDDLSVVGLDPFEGDTLVSMKRFALVLDVGSVIGAWRRGTPILVRSIRLDGPSLGLHVLEDGTASWDITKARSTAQPAEGTARAEGAAPARAMSVALSGLEITDGRVLLDDRQTHLYATLDGLRHELSGDLARDRVVVRTRTHADAATVRFAGIPYLDGVAVDFTAAVDADMAAKKYTFAENELRLNDLVLQFSGSAAKEGEGLALDVTFQAPRTEFAQILSLLPAVYAKDFASLETSGSFTVQGDVRGDLGDGAFPSFALNASVQDGTFRYPDLPLPARDIALDLSMDNPGGDADSTVVRLQRFHVAIGDQPVDASMTLRTPVSDPDVDARVKGTVNLADVGRTVKLASVDELSGVVTADAAVRARMSDVDSARWDRVSASGTASARDVTVTAAALRQPVAVREATLALSPRRAELRSLEAQLGSSDVQATGWIDNLLGFVLRGEELRGSATVGSRHFDLDEWRSDDPALEVIPVPPALDLTLDATVDRLTYGGLEMSDARGTVHVKDQRVTLDDFTMNTLGGHVGVTGFYETTDVERPTFGVGLALDSLDIAGASAAFLTVRTLAPAARFAKGAFSANLDMSGALSPDMTPLFDVLNGNGSLLTSRVALEGFPLMQRLADVLKLPDLSSPTLNAIRSSIEIRDGRMHVRPFRVRAGNFAMTVSGSTGVDQSMDYTLALAIPRAALGAEADRVVQSLASQAGRVGFDLQAADTVDVGVRVGGSVMDPSLQTSFGGVATSAQQRAEQAAGAAVERRVQAAEERVDSATDAARRRAQAQADSIVADAEERAAAVRAEARRLADEVRAEGNRRADQVLAEATNPVARTAARPVADRIRKEANDKADAMVREADGRADAIVAEARKQADALLGGG